MEIVNKNIKDLIPYENNPRINDDAVEYVANSIEQFGFKVPCVIDKDNILVTGHTRLKAAKKLKIKQIPCIVADDLSEEQIKAFRLADNKVSEQAEWDMDKLYDELDDILDLDMSDFDFDIDDVVEELAEKEREHIEWQESTQNLVENILNLGKGQFTGNNKYDIPDLEPVYELPEIKEWIGFNYVLTDKNPEGKAVHFFIDDYQFERIWNNPEKYVDKLRQYVCVATPDFSPYGDMPLIAQMWNHYRKHWVGKWLQERGVTVIPTIRSSTDPRSLEWFLDGEPEGGIVLISSMWTKQEDNSKASKEEYRLMKEKLKPCKTFVYGGEGNMGIETDDNVEFIENFAQKRWNKNG